MADWRKVIQAFENCTDPEMLDDDETYVDCIRAGECPWDDCQERDQKIIDIPLSLVMEAMELLKAQGEVIDALLKVGYPHNFQREPRWIVNYMYAITDVIEKAVNLRNEGPTIPEEKV